MGRDINPANRTLLGVFADRPGARAATHAFALAADAPDQPLAVEHDDNQQHRKNELLNAETEHDAPWSLKAVAAPQGTGLDGAKNIVGPGHARPFQAGEPHTAAQPAYLAPEDAVADLVHALSATAEQKKLV